jgi:hypothetical protein
MILLLGNYVGKRTSCAFATSYKETAQKAMEIAGNCRSKWVKNILMNILFYRMIASV